MIVVADTCVLIDHLRGVPAASEALGAYQEVRVSALAVAELRAVAAELDDGRTQAAAALDDLLDDCVIVAVDEAIAALAAGIAATTGLPLWDAVVLATARRDGLTLLTRHHGYGVDAYDARVAYDPENATAFWQRAQ